MTQRIYRPPVRRPARPAAIDRQDVPRDRPDKNPFHTHGFQDHFLLMESFDIRAENMALDSGTRVTVGTYPDALDAVNLADGVTQGVSFLMSVPPNFVSNMDLYVFWTPSATDAVAHSVRWSRDLAVVGAGLTTTVVGGTTNWTSTAQANTVNVGVVDSVLGLTFFDGLLLGGALSGTLVRFDLRRIGADAADTYLGDVQLHMVRFNYVGSN